MIKLPTKNEKSFPFNVRNWVPAIDIDETSDKVIRVVTYNILSDSLLSISTQIDEADLKKLPHLKWEKRRINILNEILELKGDIICIQEFERDEFFIEELGKNGYDVIIKLIILVFL